MPGGDKQDRIYAPSALRHMPHFLLVALTTVTVSLVLLVLALSFALAWEGIYTTLEQLIWWVGAGLLGGTAWAHASSLMRRGTHVKPWNQLAWTVSLTAFLAFSELWLIWAGLLAPVLLIDIVLWRLRSSRKADRPELRAARPWLAVIESGVQFLRGESPSITFALQRSFGFDAFISYRSGAEPAGGGDVPRALHGALTKLGHTSFLDLGEIQPGDPLRSTINDALARSRCLALLLSEQAIESDWVIHEAKIYLQASVGNLILPFFLSRAALNAAKESESWRFLFAPEVDRLHVAIAPSLEVAVRAEVIASAISKSLAGQRTRRVSAWIGRMIAITVAGLGLFSVGFASLYALKTGDARREAISGLVFSRIATGEMADAVALAADAEEQRFLSKNNESIMAAFSRARHPIASIHLGSPVVAYEVNSIVSVLATTDGRLHQFDLSDGYYHELPGLSHAEDEITTVAFLEGVEPAAIGRKSGAIVYFGTLLPENPHNSSIKWIFPREDGLTSIDTSGVVVFWDCTHPKGNCKPSLQYRLDSPPTAAAASFFRQHIVVGEQSGVVTKFVPAERRIQADQLLRPDPVVAVGFGGDPRSRDLKIFAASKGGIVSIGKIDESPTRVFYADARKGSAVIAAAFDEVMGGRYAIATNYGEVVLRNSSNGEEISRISGDEEVQTLVMSRSATSMFVLYRGGVVQQWTFGKVKLATFQADTKEIVMLALDKTSDSSSLLLTVDYTGVARTWSVADPKPRSIADLGEAYGNSMSTGLCAAARPLLPAEPLRCMAQLQGCDRNEKPRTIGNVTRVTHSALTSACSRRSFTMSLLPFIHMAEQRVR